MKNENDFVFLPNICSTRTGNSCLSSSFQKEHDLPLDILQLELEASEPKGVNYEKKLNQGGSKR